LRSTAALPPRCLCLSTSARLSFFSGHPPNAVDRELYRRGIVLYASEPTTSAIKQPAVAIIQGLLRKPGFDVNFFNQKTLHEALLQGNLRKLTATTAGENLFRKRTAQNDYSSARRNA
jgi:hypothetical protein